MLLFSCMLRMTVSLLPLKHDTDGNNFLNEQVWYLTFYHNPYETTSISYVNTETFHGLPYNLEAQNAVLLKAVATLESEGRPKCFLIKSPANMSFLRSTLVFTPSPLSIYTTSSVATLPLAPLAYGQPPRPDTDESTTLIPVCFKRMNE